MLISATRKPCFENVHDNGLPDNGAARRGGFCKLSFEERSMRLEWKTNVPFIVLIIFHGKQSFPGRTHGDF